MKKIFSLLAAVLSVSVISFSCEKANLDDNKSTTVYTAEAQKTKLQDIALELMGKFNPEDQRKAVELADYLGALYEDYEWDFSEVEEHYNKDDYQFLNHVTKSVRYMVQGDVTSNFATDLFANATGEKKEVYKFANIDAEWEADEAAHTWKYKGKGKGGLVLKFKGPNNVACEAKLSGVDGDITYSGTYQACDYDTEDENGGHSHKDVPIEVVIPKNVNFYIKEGNTEHFSLNINFDIKKSDHLNFDFATKITNLTIAGGVKISKNAASCAYLVKLGNESLIQAIGDLKNCGLVDKASYQDWEDWFKMYGDMLEAYELQLGSVVGQVDILGGKLTLKTTTTDITQFIKNSNELYDKYGKNENPNNCWYEDYYYQALYNKDKADILNKFLNIGLYYGDSKSLQAQMRWEASYKDVEHQHWNSNTQEYEDKMHQLWDHDPVIYFPSDGTSYNFEKYFTEKSFNRLINSTESFLNAYIRLSQRWGKDHKIEF